MSEWSFLTNHARALLCIAHDPGVRLRDIASELGITERSAYGIVNDLAAAGYVVKERDGRRNRYEIQQHVPLQEPTARERTIGDVLDLLVDKKRRVELSKARAATDGNGRAAPVGNGRAAPVGNGRAAPVGNGRAAPVGNGRAAEHDNASRA
jgi:DNA-binding MarR family transcriptional regulator